MNRKILGALTGGAFVCVFHTIGADNSNAPAPKPCLISISVADIERSVNWYHDALGFAISKRIDLPKYSLRIAFLDLNGFKIEMIEPAKSVSLDEIKKRFPEVDDRTKVQGLDKFGFRVEKIDSVAARLKKLGVQFVREVQDDAQFHERWFIISDPDGNWIQFFETIP